MTPPSDIVTQGRLVADWIRGLGFPAYAEAVDALAAIVERLPVTADGVRVVPGVDYVYDGSPLTRHCWGGATASPDRTRLEPLAVIAEPHDDVHVECHLPWPRAYSTHEAAVASALAAREGSLP